MKKIISSFIFFLILPLLFSLIVNGSSIYEYYFYPSETEAENYNVSGKYDSFFDSLPDEIKERLPSDILSGNINDIAKDSEKINNFSYIWNELINAAVRTLFPSFKTTLIIIGILILSSLIRLCRRNIADSTNNKLADTVINVAVILSVSSTAMIVFEDVERFKSLICNLMNGIIPVFGVIYTATGNGSTSAVQCGGVMLLVALCQNLFAIIVLPSIRICLLMSIADSVFPDSGIGPIANAFKNISVSIIVISVTLFSFILTLQNTVSQTADTFGIKSIKFAVGNLIPLIGGAVSDSLGTIGGGLSVLKNAGGTIVIVLVIIILLPTLGMLLMRRLSFFICKTVAGILGGKSEEKLLSDLGSVMSIMLAFSVAISISFIYLLTLFTGSSLAILA